MKTDLAKTFMNQIYSRPLHKVYITNKTIFKANDDTLSTDKLDLNDYGPENIRGYRFTLVVIGSYSKLGWTVP